VRLLIKRGANLHMKNKYGSTPLDRAKGCNNPSTAAIIEAAMQSIKVIYTSSDNLKQQYRPQRNTVIRIFNRSRHNYHSTITFKGFNTNIIILTDNDIPRRFKFERYPTFTLQHIQEYIDQLPPTAVKEDSISPWRCSAISQ